MRDMDTGEPLSTIRDRILSANAYIGAFPLAEALDTGADVVIAGRSTDTALTLAPMIHRFGWRPDEYDKLAAGTIAGHIIECGAQCTGGNCQVDWQTIPDMANIGYPIVEAEPDGTLQRHQARRHRRARHPPTPSRSNCSTSWAIRSTTSRPIAWPISPAFSWKTPARIACASPAFAAARGRPR